MTNRILTVIALLAWLTAAGCMPISTSAEQSEKSSSPEQMFKAAEELYNKEKYTQAVDVYEQIKSAHPDFKDMPKVYLRIAEAQYNAKEYDKAIGRFLQFVQLYPNDPDIAKAKYFVAMSYFNQIKNTDLDSRIIQKSAEAFKQLASDTEAGEWGKKAEEKHRECLQKLAEKEYQKARTYIGLGNYTGARMATRRILDEYPKLGFDEKANDLLKKIKNK